MASIEYVDVRKGMVIVGDDGQLYQCLDRDLNTPGNWRAILQLKLKNLKTGSITMNRVRPQDKVELAYLEKKDYQYLYQEGDDYVFMDTRDLRPVHRSPKELRRRPDEVPEGKRQRQADDSTRASRSTWNCRRRSSSR